MGWFSSFDVAEQQIRMAAIVPIPITILIQIVISSILVRSERSKHAIYKYTHGKQVLATTLLIYLGFSSLTFGALWFGYIEELPTIINYTYILLVSVLVTLMFSVFEFASHIYDSNNYHISTILIDDITRKREKELFPVDKLGDNEVVELLTNLKKRIKNLSKLSLITENLSEEQIARWRLHSKQTTLKERFLMLDRIKPGIYDFATNLVGLDIQIDVYRGGYPAREKFDIYFCFPKNKALWMQRATDFDVNQLVKKPGEHCFKIIQDRIEMLTGKSSKNSAIVTEGVYVPFFEFWYNNIMSLIGMRVNYIMPTQDLSKIIRFLFGLFKLIALGSFFMIIISGK